MADPETILDDIRLKSGATFVDLGCGAGFFAIPAARLVGEGKRVYGLDSDAEAISALWDRALRENLTNLTPEVGEV